MDAKDSASLLRPTMPTGIGDAALVFGVVFAASIFGILTRPLGFLAAFWPANALLLGLMVRNPRLATPWGWVAASLGYVISDVAFGDALDVAVVLTLANLAFVTAGVFAYQRLPPEMSRFEAPLSALCMFGICCLGALCSALVAMSVAAQVLPSLWSKGWLLGMGYWFSSELVNGILIVPLVLVFPRIWAAKDRRQGTPAEQQRTRWHLMRFGPGLSVAGTVAASMLIGGPGAIAFPIPALLWCAFDYRLVTTIALTFVVCVWQIIAASMGLLDIPTGDFMSHTVSLRLGIALMALGPLTVASVSSQRNELMRRLRASVNYDFLTGALSRSAFFRRGQRLLDAGGTQGPVAALMLDIDHFKRVNDENGHAGGDAVLRSFACTVANALRNEDLVGRLGGEEFAVLLPGGSRENALATAERLRAVVSQQTVEVEAGRSLSITVSIGVAFEEGSSGAPLEALLQRADQALYEAKGAGRNRVVTAS